MTHQLTPDQLQNILSQTLSPDTNSRKSGMSFIVSCSFVFHVLVHGYARQDFQNDPNWFFLFKYCHSFLL
jgi:hypothetical protein